MAHIDNLVASIQDQALRSALHSEVRKLTGNRQFGLVFNEHKPESVLLHKQTTVRRGDKVQVLAPGTEDRTEVDGSGVWIVTAINNGLVKLTNKTDTSLTRQEPRARCVVIREFGDPIYPGLKSTGRVERGGDKPYHTIINGENFHALQALRYPFAGKVDVIYVDPPYNTGARDWKYNNDYVDDTDPYRHSKWLSFMQKRLEIARELLNPSSSVLIVTIDEKEVHRLGMLIEQVFPGARVQMVSIAINGAVVSRANAFGRADEYAFFVYIGEAGPAPVSLGSEWSTAKGVTHRGEIRWDRLIRSGTNAERKDRPRLFYPIFVDEDGVRIKSVGEPISPHESRASISAPPGCVAVWPIRANGAEGNWQISPAALRDSIAAGYVRLGRFTREGMALSYLKSGERKKVETGLYEVVGHRPDGSIVTNNIGEFAGRSLPSTQWRVAAHDASHHGSRLLLKLLPDRKFPFPKSLYAVEDCLRFFVADKPDALILDFFAGSGTTGHAVMRLNAEDGGRRRSVMVTNNEVSADEADRLRAAGLHPGDPEWENLGICRYITIPRITAAVTGQTAGGDLVSGRYRFVNEFEISEGLRENVEFFDLTYEDPNLVSLGRKFHAVAPLLWLMAGAPGERVSEVATDGWAVPADGSYGVLFEPELWSDFTEAVNKRDAGGDPLSHVFVVTDSESEYRQVVAKLPQQVVTQQLYRDYLRNFEINVQA